MMTTPRDYGTTEADQIAATQAGPPLARLVAKLPGYAPLTYDLTAEDVHALAVLVDVEGAPRLGVAHAMLQRYAWLHLTGTAKVRAAYPSLRPLVEAYSSGPHGAEGRVSEAPWNTLRYVAAVRDVVIGRAPSPVPGAIHWASGPLAVKRINQGWPFVTAKPRDEKRDGNRAQNTFFASPDGKSRKLVITLAAR